MLGGNYIRCPLQSIQLSYREYRCERMVGFCKEAMPTKEHKILRIRGKQVTTKAGKSCLLAKATPGPAGKLVQLSGMHLR